MRAGETFYLRPPDEMAELFADYPEAISNTRKIADQCNLEFDFGRIQLPEFEIPDGLTPSAYLRRLCEEGLINAMTKSRRRSRPVWTRN